MSQTRLYDFGSLLTQGRSKTFGTSLFDEGIYQGMDLAVTSSILLTLAPGAFMMPHGVLAVEDDPTEIAFATPAVATEFHVVAQHGDLQAIGGSPVSYTLETVPYTIPPNGIVLAVINHPGVVTITADMVTQPAALGQEALLARSAPPLSLFAPFAEMYNLVEGANIVRTAESYGGGAQVLGMGVENTAGVGSQTLVFDLPLLTTDRKPLSVDIFADLPSLCSIQIDLFDTTNSAVTLTPVSVSGTAVGVEGTPVGTLVLDTDAANVRNATPTPYRMQVTITVAAGAKVFLSRLAVNYNV